MPIELKPLVSKAHVLNHLITVFPIFLSSSPCSCIYCKVPESDKSQRGFSKIHKTENSKQIGMKENKSQNGIWI